MSNDLLKDFKDCPFCGGHDFRITSEESYNRMLDENGSACIGFDCRTCDAGMDEFTDSIRNYRSKVKALQEKWNKRIYEPDPRVSKLEAESDYIGIKIERLEGEIQGMRFALKCLGASGAYVE